MHLKKRTTCRVCGSKELTPCIDLGYQNLQGSFVTETQKPSTRKIPTALVRCDPNKDENACGLVQLSHTVPPEMLYSDYWYRSGTNHTMRNHLKEIADEVRQMFVTDNAHKILDIGSNDGTLLGYFPDSWIRVGVEPSNASMFAQFNEKINIVKDTFPSLKLETKYPEMHFDVITSIAMFYDLEDPVYFAHSVQRMLSPDGIWVVEMSYLPDMLSMNSFDTICHEHLEYYSLATLEYIVKRAGMRICRVQRNSINGGSIRCWVVNRFNDLSKDEWKAEIDQLRKSEFDLCLDTSKPYEEFHARICKVRDQLTRFIVSALKNGEEIHVYGASTKGNTLLQWCGLDNKHITRAADRNPNKHGAYTLGTNIMIISEEESRAMRPDWYLVLPWHFREEILMRENETIMKGTGMIFPLPEFKAIKVS